MSGSAGDRAGVRPQEDGGGAARGFTILEVVIALAILTLFGFGFITLHLAHGRLIEAADRAASLTALARRAYEETREVPFDDLLALDGASALVDASGEPTPSEQGAYRVTYACSIAEPGVIAVAVHVGPADANSGPGDGIRVVTARARP